MMNQESLYPLAQRQTNTFSLMGIPIHRITVRDLETFIENVFKEGSKAIIAYVNIHGMNLAYEYPWLRDFFQEVQVVICDGDGVRWGIKLLGGDPPPKITFTRYIWNIAEFCERHHYRIFLLGGKSGVAQEAAEQIKRKYPRLEIAGCYHGYFDKDGEESEKLIMRLNVIQPDVLIVGFGMPAQEKWLYQNWKRIHAHLFLPVGAALDYVSGRMKNVPSWMIRWHMEWLFRLAEEPVRLFSRYVFGIPYFFWRICLEKRRRSERGFLR
ncbi:MAG: WecB/TagA/CpsF family glycosyltransferase [Candidatus Omnitrophica bacterium]|nr:WecB/TagA/CpsF family glycosyltransferase [Candidatus Omnitrophota bacterium]